MAQDCDTLVRFRPDGRTHSVQPDLAGQWGYRSATQLLLRERSYFHLIATDNDANSYWILGGPAIATAMGTLSITTSVTVGNKLYTTTPGGLIIFSFDYCGNVRWQVPLSTPDGTPLTANDIKYNGRDLIVFTGNANAPTTIVFGDVSTPIANLAGIFLGAITTSGKPIAITEIVIPFNDGGGCVLATEVVDSVTTVYVLSQSDSVTAVQIVAGAFVVFPLQTLPPLLTTGLIVADGQGYLYITCRADEATTTVTLLDGRTATFNDSAILIYGTQQQSPGIVVGPNGAPSAVWVFDVPSAIRTKVLPRTVNVPITDLVYTNNRVYVAFTNAGEVSVNGVAFGNPGTPGAGPAANLSTLYIVAMPRGVSSFVDGQFGPFPLANYSMEYPGTLEQGRVFYVFVRIAADDGGNIYAFITSAITQQGLNPIIPISVAIRIRAGRQTTKTPTLLRLNRDLSVISAQSIVGPVNASGSNAEIVANTRGDVWISFDCVSNQPIVYDNLYLPTLPSSNGNVIIHATIDRAVDLLGYGKGKTQWPALTIPKSVGFPGQEVGITDNGRFAPVSQSNTTEIVPHGLSLGNALLLTPE